MCTRCDWKTSVEFVRESRVSMGWCAASEGWLASAAHLLTRESIEWVVVVAVGRHLSVVCRRSPLRTRTVNSREMDHLPPFFAERLHRLVLCTTHVYTVLT